MVTFEADTIIGKSDKSTVIPDTSTPDTYSNDFEQLDNIDPDLKAVQSLTDDSYANNPDYFDQLNNNDEDTTKYLINCGLIKRESQWNTVMIANAVTPEFKGSENTRITNQLNSPSGTYINDGYSKSLSEQNVEDKLPYNKWFNKITSNGQNWLNGANLKLIPGLCKVSINHKQNIDLKNTIGWDYGRARVTGNDPKEIIVEIKMNNTDFYSWKNEILPILQVANYNQKTENIMILWNPLLELNNIRYVILESCTQKTPEVGIIDIELRFIEKASLKRIYGS